MLLAAASLASCTSGTEQRPVVDAADDATARDEAARLAATEGRAERHGDTLMLQLKGRGRATLVNDTTSADQWTLYTFDQHLAGVPYYGVHVSYFEGSAYLIVHDSTGRRTQLDAAPVVSPDRTRLATASMDLEAAFDPTRLFVGIIDGDSLRTEFEVAPTNWGPDSLRWIAPDTVQFTQHWATTDPGIYASALAHLVRDQKDWRLVSSRP